MVYPERPGGRQRVASDTSGFNLRSQDLPPLSSGACRAMPEAIPPFSAICGGMQLLANAQGDLFVVASRSRPSRVSACQSAKEVHSRLSLLVRIARRMGEDESLRRRAWLSYREDGTC